MILTTTDSVDGYTIVHYFPPIVANLVAGTGALSDIVAGFSDIFGGRSETYQRYFTDMYAEAVKELEDKAKILGANCVVGARFDLDQISGKGMQMFMLNAIATPVVIKTPAEIADAEEAQARDRVQLEMAEAERRERFADVQSVLGLLNDPDLAEQARGLRRMYGRGVVASFLQQKASELGLEGMEISEDDIPEKF